MSARVQIGFKLEPEEEELLRDIQTQLGLGRIYISNGGREDRQIRFQTTNVVDTIALCELILPYLRLKRKQCEGLLRIAGIITAAMGRRYIKGHLTTSADMYSKEDLKEIIKLSTTMNASRQTTKYRKTVGRDTEYYLALVDRMYDM